MEGTQRTERASTRKREKRRQAIGIARCGADAAPAIGPGRAIDRHPEDTSRPGDRSRLVPSGCRSIARRDAGRHRLLHDVGQSPLRLPPFLRFSELKLVPFPPRLRHLTTRLGATSSDPRSTRDAQGGCSRRLPSPSGRAVLKPVPRVVRRNAEQQCRQLARRANRRGESDQDTDGGDRQASPKHASGDVDPAGAERESYADFSRSLRNQVRGHPVGPAKRQDQCESRKDAEQPRVSSPLRHRLRAWPRPSSGSVHREFDRVSRRIERAVGVKAPGACSCLNRDRELCVGLGDRV